MTCLVDRSDLARVFANEHVEGVVEAFEEVDQERSNFWTLPAGVWSPYSLRMQSTTSPPRSAISAYLPCIHLTAIHTLLYLLVSAHIVLVSLCLCPVACTSCIYDLVSRDSNVFPSPAALEIYCLTNNV